MTHPLGHSIVALLPRLRGFARALTGNAVEADDLVQATCERALRGADGFEPGTRLDSWLYRIMRNQRVDDVRRARPVAPLDESGVAETVAGEDGRAVAETRLFAGEVGAVIAALPREQREALVLVCVEEMSYREAAETLGVPVGTVMSRLSRARRAVAEAIEASPATAGRRN